MKIIKIYYEQYKIPLRDEFKNSQTKYKDQEGLILTIQTDKNIGIGEAVLLKGFSNNTMQEIIWAVESFIAGIQKEEEYTLDELLVMAEIQCSNTPSIQFAIDTALYDIESQKKHISLSKFFNKQSLNYINYSQILINQNTTINNDIIKLKVGINRINDDVSFLNKISQEHPLMKIRLDANQLYSIEEFDTLYQQISHLNIDFFEEPIENPNTKKLEYFKIKYSNLNYAIDESLYQNKGYQEWIQKKLITTIIIRPSILGSFKEFFKIVKLYNDSLQLLISSSLENSIGNMAIIHLASTLEKTSKHGVNIYSFFNEFVTPPLYQADKIELNNLIGLGFKHDQ